MKKGIFDLTQKWQKSFKNVSPTASTYLGAVTKVISFTFDVTKDVVLWVFLYHRIGNIDQSGYLNSTFIIGLIFVNLVILLLAQSIMGVFIIRRLDR